MRRLACSALAWAAVMSPGASARAVALVFEAVPVTESLPSGCAAPCFHIQTFLEDPTRSIELTAIYFELDVIRATAVVGGTNVQTPNVSVEDADANIQLIPFPLTVVGNIGAGVTPGFDVLFVLGSDVRRSVQSLADIRSASVGCFPAAICTTQLDGLDANRIYLGRFNITGLVRSDDPNLQTRIRLSILELLTEDPSSSSEPPEIRRLNGGSCGFPATGACIITPEPASLLLVCMGLAALVLIGQRLWRG
jgi:hypothetical protein